MNPHFTTQSKLLGQFYADWLSAARGSHGADLRPEWFSPWTGLCYNLELWCAARGETARHETLLREMQRQFINAHLDPFAPFNNGSLAEYFADKYAARNEARIAWAAAHAAE